MATLNVHISRSRKKADSGASKCTKWPDKERVNFFKKPKMPLPKLKCLEAVARSLFWRCSNRRSPFSSHSKHTHTHTHVHTTSYLDIECVWQVQKLSWLITAAFSCKLAPLSLSPRYTNSFLSPPLDDGDTSEQNGTFLEKLLLSLEPAFFKVSFYMCFKYI